MKYYSTQQMAKIWNISSRRIAIIAKQGRIPGVMQVGTRWMIPENAVKPIDGRTRQGVSNYNDNSFRLPLFVNLKENEFNPILSKEEKELRKAQLDFNACEYEKAKKIFLSLNDSTNNPYIRIVSTIHLCLIMAITNDSEQFLMYQRNLDLLLSDKLTYYNEIILMKYVYDVIMGSINNILNDFSIDTNYNYHPSALPILSVLSIFTATNGDISTVSKLRLDPFESLCQQLECSGNFYEAQLLHIELAYAYHMKANLNNANHHMCKAIKIAYDNNLLHLVVENIPYLPEIFDSVSSEFNKDFINKLKHYSKLTHDGYVSLNKALGKKTIYTSLSSKDYRFVYLATQGYTNKEIAGFMKTSDTYVSKRLSEIYRKFNIAGKNELIKLFTAAIKK